jgi:hypothetical protein
MAVSVVLRSEGSLECGFFVGQHEEMAGEKEHAAVN